MRVTVRQLKGLIREAISEGVFMGGPKGHATQVLSGVMKGLERLPNNATIEDFSSLPYVEEMNGQVVVVLGKME